MEGRGSGVRVRASLQPKFRRTRALSSILPSFLFATSFKYVMSDAENDELIDDLEEDVADVNVMHIGASLDPPEARLYTTEQLHSTSSSRSLCHSLTFILYDKQL